jgi:ornithine carbamoyltransferase
VTENTLAGKTLGLVFDKVSTRTRVSFQAAMTQMGGASLFINTRDSQISRSELVRDTARVLSRYLDVLAIRTYSQDQLEEFARYADIPVINALTDLYHPCQVLSDLMTVIECKGGYEGLKYAWVGDGNNVSHSWINAASVLGLDLTLACPEGYWPKNEVLGAARAGGQKPIRILHDPVEAVSGADVIYTDAWVSMGQESEYSQRRQRFEPYQVNEALVAQAKPDAIVMHCLPAHRGEEISESVLEGPQSVVWDQSENKMHMHKAVLEILIKRENDE